MTEQENPQPQEGEEQEAKTFDAEYVDKLRKEAAKYRTEAKANADAAKRLSELEQSNKTEAEKQAERIANLEKQLEQAGQEALRRRVQAAHGIDDEDADLFLTGSDEETLTAQAKRLAERESERKKRSNHVPNEGSNPRPEPDERRAFADFLVGR